MTQHQFYDFTTDGVIRCRICGALEGRHEATCGLVTLRTHVQELATQLGCYVATMRELLDAVDAVVRGDVGAR